MEVFVKIVRGISYFILPVATFLIVMDLIFPTWDNLFPDGPADPGLKAFVTVTDILLFFAPICIILFLHPTTLNSDTTPGNLNGAVPVAPRKRIISDLIKIALLILLPLLFLGFWSLIFGLLMGGFASP